MSIYTIKIVGEANDIAPIIIKENIVIESDWNNFKMMDEAHFLNWERIFIFPDNEKAEFFQANFKPNMYDYREGMLKDDYIFHIINCTYPEPKEIYADQIRMEKDYISIKEEMKGM